MRSPKDASQQDDLALPPIFGYGEGIGREGYLPPEVFLRRDTQIPGIERELEARVGHPHDLVANGDRDPAKVPGYRFALPVETGFRRAIFYRRIVRLKLGEPSVEVLVSEIFDVIDLHSKYGRSKLAFNIL